MKINHLIVGCLDLKKSAQFYCDLFGFTILENFLDTGTRKEGLILKSYDAVNPLNILLVPVIKTRLPSPQHLAFEVEKNQFDGIFQKAQDLKITVRAEPSLFSQKEGLGELEFHGQKYQHFFVCDPTLVNIEIMLKI